MSRPSMSLLDYDRLVPPGLLRPPPVRVVPGAVSHLQVPFAEYHGWRALRLDLHLPAAGPGPYPVVVYVHGGSFLTGLPGMGPWRTLPQRGIAVASVGYRFSGEVKFPGPVEDVRAAVAWTHAQAGVYGLDPDRIALWGSSAGGYLAALAAVTEQLAPPPRLLAEPSGRPLVRAVVAHYPVTAPDALREDALEPSNLGELVAAFFGGTQLPTAVADHLGDAAPAPPFLFQHGDADRRVGLGQSRRLHERLLAAGVSSRLVVVPGGDHGSPEFESPECVDEAERFLRRSWNEVAP
ncbi:alpha/beta hydrolase [Amycolatopsis rhabdoformis]|uniref:Alpha/beta hydrolase n=1 Tax=Amycolatopsis rhabdoformis TaxID=1448059 RepID=A0ABZ1HXS0_9PSEU|nr:alpha/beta hydrolase [Amycolatopsis rhabdoformis]WSE26168.1 alpha/beta hydrolase [Amycolatopsis rhabdoformis]